MSSTNVHSNLHIVGGQTIPGEPNEVLEMPPQASGMGPAKIEVIKGEKAEISVQDNIVARDENGTKPRAICKQGTEINNMDIKDIVIVMCGPISAFQQAIESKAKASKKQRGTLNDGQEMDR